MAINGSSGSARVAASARLPAARAGGLGRGLLSSGLVQFGAFVLSVFWTDLRAEATWIAVGSHKRSHPRLFLLVLA